MKINIDVKPKEWVSIAAFVLIIYCVANDYISLALKILSLWFGKG